jgi:hypothetical protein
MFKAGMRRSLAVFVISCLSVAVLSIATFPAIICITHSIATFSEIPVGSTYPIYPYIDSGFKSLD